MKRIIQPVKDFYLRNERLISSLSLVGGFVFDFIALERVDMLWENVWVGGHLLIAAVAMLLINYVEAKQKNSKHYSKMHFWLIITIQFAFGGLLSAVLVFYFRSATLSASWPFLLLLCLAFAANELLKHRYSRLTFQIGMLFLSIYAFFIFIVPIIVHSIGVFSFILAGIVSLVSIAFFISSLRYFNTEQYNKSKIGIFVSIIFITAIINALYFTNLIPPLPLSLKDAGIYHAVVRNHDGEYEVTTEPRNPILDYFSFSTAFHAVPGETAYAYSAVFSPTSLNTTIIHNWKLYNEQTKQWVTQSTVKLPIYGGRGEGYRTYSQKASLMPGTWRVDVETLNGQKIGRIQFNVLSASTTPSLVTKTLK